MRGFVPAYFSDNRSFQLVLNPNVKIEVVTKVRILHKQGNNLKTTTNSSYQLERICTWTAILMGIMELVDTSGVREPYVHVSNDVHISM